MLPGEHPRCLPAADSLVAPVSLLLGLCFPIGMRLVRRISEDATPWMWGVNGACGVLGAVLAVGVSIWGGIQLNLWIATALYALLVLVAPLLRVLVARATEPAPAALPNPYTEQVSRSRVTG